MSFDAVLGQEHAKGLVRAAIDGGRMGHAYLFSGPDGVGKTRLALEVAKVLFCRGEGARSCDACGDCRMVDHNRHPDLLLVEAPEDKRFISIEQAREMGRYLSLKPMQAERRVVVVREVERLQEAAANSILKTLEEPSPFGMLILTTARPRALLDTIRSRCQQITFAPLSAEHVYRILSAHPEFGEDEIRAASRFAQGSAGKALQILEYECLDVFGETLDGALALPRGDTFTMADALLDWARSVSKKLEPQRERIREVLRLLTCAYRDALLANAGAPRAEMLGSDSAARVADLGRRLPSARIMGIIEALWEARRQTDANASLGLVLDNLFVRIGELQTT